MADIRCQMCGKPNPAEAEVCQYCQARLKPVWASKSADRFFENESEAEPESEVPEWLSSLRGSEETPPGKPREEAADEESFGGFESRTEGSSEDWLAELGKPEEVPPEVVGGIFDLQEGEDLAEWLSDASQPTAEPPASTEFEISSEEKPAEADSGTAEEPFDWLSEFKAEPQAGQEQPKGFPFDQELTPSGEEQVPDWLTRMTLGESELPSDSQALPDWMKDASPAAQDEFGAFFSSDLDTVGSAASTTPESGVSDTAGVDWLTGVYGEAATEPPDLSAAEAKGPSPDQEGFPDWLSALGVTSEQETPLTGWESKPPAPPESLESVAPPEADQSLDWLAELGGESQVPFESPAEQPEAPVSAFSGLDDLSAISQDQSMPDWLANLDAQGLPSTGGGPSPFVPDEPEGVEPEAEYLTTTPDWLSQVGLEQSEVIEEEQPLPEASQEAGLEQAELPNWLEAMRPVEVGASEPYKDITDDRLESQGPLAGLRGALPVGPHAVRQRKPTTTTLKVQVPEEQQNRAIVLQNLLEDESVAKPLPAPSQAAIPILLRVGIFGAFVLVAFFAFWLGGKQVPLPAINLIPQSVQDFHNQVESLPAGGPVLVAVDYEPGFAGELDGAATAILSHLANQEALVTFVSTTYNGPALAQRLMQAVNRQAEFLQTPFTGFRNLGYIPGGVAGLAAFVRSPDSVLPYDLNNNRAWDTAPLEATKGIRNFAMVIVITQDADTARAWIEQAKPSLGEIPLQLLVSAQAEPLVHPYYAGLPRQASGLVSGLAGGVAYEVLEGRLGMASQAWDAYSISLTLAVLIVLVGGVFGVGSLTLTQYRQAKIEGKA